MLTARTTALIAAMAVMGTVAPAAFANEYDPSDFVIINDVYQSNEANYDISQSQFAVANAETGDYSYGDATAVVSQSQGFCIQDNQANQVSGGNSRSEQENEDYAEATASADYGSYARADATKDCS